MIWLLGNRGQLGQDVEQLLVEKQEKFISSDIEVDKRDKERLKSFVNGKQVDWIVDCSAYTAVDRAEKEPDKAFGVNAHGTLNIAEIACDKALKLIYISTDYIFNGEKEGAYSEDDTPGPLGVYGKSKLEGEINIKNNVKEYYIIRTSWLYGHHGNNFVNTMLDLLNKKSEVKVVADQWGSPTWTKDLARVMVHIIESDNGEYGVYHYSGEGKTSWFYFTQEIYARARTHGIVKRDVKISPITTEEYPADARRPRNSYLSKDKIKTSFKIEVPRWQDSLEEFLAEIKEE
ncbi:MAG: dTDP-4-dehydrorhamnose reductase [Spirochaetota bacterium]|nr:MAG: dTDP-4-dehydrorhamnose reductase [Spirochaetota bacterium]